MVSETAVFSKALSVFAPIARQTGGEQLGDSVLAAAREPDNPNVLSQLGRSIADCGIGDIQATVLTRAHAQAPDDVDIAILLAISLENERRHVEACQVLEDIPDLAQTHHVACYILAINSILHGDVEKVRVLQPQLEQSFADDVIPKRVGGMLQRADSVAGMCSLDERDLRGWHYVLNGGLLLFLASAGFESPMHGRYAFIYDSDDRCLAAIHRLKAVLQRLNIDIPRVFALPDRKSTTLATALAQALGCGLVDWSKDGSQDPGVIVAYDMDVIGPEIGGSLTEKRPGQILWAHALCWTKPYPVAPDVVSYLHQFNVPSWERDNRNETQTVDLAVLAARILDAEPNSVDAIEDEDALLSLVAVSAMQCSSGRRSAQLVGGPVKSSRFP